MANRPAEVLGLAHKGSLAPGHDADVIVLNPQIRWVVEPGEFYSLARNTPFAGWQLLGRVEHVLVGGAIRFSRVAEVAG